MDAFRICLVNMPFASPEAPSLGLTQLRAVLEEKLGDRVAVEILYLDLDFLEFTGGLDAYRRIISGQGRLTGAPDWFFRQAAFPETADNTRAYLDRFYFAKDEDTRRARQFLSEKRPQVEAFLDTLIDRHRLAEAAVVGFTTLFFQTVASLAMARRIKDRNPEVVTVIGGAACESEMGLEFARQAEAIDFVFSGPALESFPEFAGHLLSGNRRACDRIAGVFSKTNLEAVRPAEGCSTLPGAENLPFVAPTGRERDINEVVPLDYRGFLQRLETAVGEELPPMLPFETSRGCRWGEKVACTFCGLNGTAMRYRSMKPERALRQIRDLLGRHPDCRFFLAVDTILPVEYLDEVFPSLEPPPGAAIMYEVRPNLSDSRLEVLRRAGVVVIQPGIEALSTATLKLMRKGTTAFNNIDFLKRCSRLPLRVEWNLLIGSPGEPESTWRKYLDDLPLLHHLHPPGGAYPISYDRFSRYFQRPAAWNLDLRPHEFYAWVYPFGEDALARIAYHFIDRNTPPRRLDPWLDRLNRSIAQWRLRWENRDHRDDAQLCLLRDGGRALIYDSRSGEGADFSISPAAEKMLAYLETPRRPDRIAEKFGSESTARELAFLREKRLLFEEDGRVMSLVIL